MKERAAFGALGLKPKSGQALVSRHEHPHAYQYTPSNNAPPSQPC